jgi:hypothetical protein
MRTEAPVVCLVPLLCKGSAKSSSRKQPTLPDTNSARVWALGFSLHSCRFAVLLTSQWRQQG